MMRGMALNEPEEQFIIHRVLKTPISVVIWRGEVGRWWMVRHQANIG